MQVFTWFCSLISACIFRIPNENKTVKSLVTVHNTVPFTIGLTGPFLRTLGIVAQLSMCAVESDHVGMFVLVVIDRQMEPAGLQVCPLM